MEAVPPQWKALIGLLALACESVVEGGGGWTPNLGRWGKGHGILQGEHSFWSLEKGGGSVRSDSSKNGHVITEV